MHKENKGKDRKNKVIKLLKCSEILDIHNNINKIGMNNNNKMNN
jgi:hypothetical protein